MAHEPDPPDIEILADVEATIVEIPPTPEKDAIELDSTEVTPLKRGPDVDWANEPPIIASIPRTDGGSKFSSPPTDPDHIPTRPLPKRPHVNPDTAVVLEIERTLKTLIAITRKADPLNVLPVIDRGLVAQAHQILNVISGVALSKSIESSPSTTQLDRMNTTLEEITNRLNKIESRGSQPQSNTPQTSKKAAQQPAENAPNTLIKSANPIPFTPVNNKKNAADKPAPKPESPTSPEMKLRRLIFDLDSPEDGIPKPKGGLVVAKANEYLARRNSPIKISALGWSMANNPILIVKQGQLAAGLVEFDEGLMQCIYPDRAANSFRCHADVDRFRAKLNGASTRNLAGRAVPSEIWDSAKEENAQLRNMVLACEPEWLGDPSGDYGSLVISFISESDRAIFVQMKSIIANGDACTATHYEERPSPRYCANCASIRHLTTSCHTPKCTICTSEDHGASQHPKDKAAFCINCKGAHGGKDRDCPERIKRLGHPGAKGTKGKSKAKKATLREDPATGANSIKPNNNTFRDLGESTEKEKTNKDTRPKTWKGIKCTRVGDLELIEGNWVPTMKWFDEHKEELQGYGKGGGGEREGGGSPIPSTSIDIRSFVPAPSTSKLTPQTKNATSVNDEDTEMQAND